MQVYDKEQNTLFTWQGKPQWKDLGRWNHVHRVFGNIRGMCRGNKDIIYIVDSSSEAFLSAYQNNGKRIRTFGRGKLSKPAFVACDRLGRIYVTDEKDCCVCVFDDTGNFILKFASEGEDNGKLMGPTGICVDPMGNLLVADSLNNRISVFAPDGRFMHHLVSENNIMQPLGIDLSRDGLLAVTSQYISFKSVSVYKIC